MLVYCWRRQHRKCLAGCSLHENEFMRHLSKNIRAYLIVSRDPLGDLEDSSLVIGARHRQAKQYKGHQPKHSVQRRGRGTWDTS